MTDSNKSFDTIEASDIALSQVDTGARAGADSKALNKLRSRPQAIYVIAILCLVTASLAFIIFQNNQRAKAVAEHQSTETTRPVSPATTIVYNDATSPDQSSQPSKQAPATKQRRQAQDLLANILEKQKALESQQVTQWAETDYRSAQEQAEQGDLLYQQAHYPAAQEQYQLSLDLLSNMESRIPALINNKLASGIAAIEAEDITHARTDFELVLAIQPNNDAANNGLQRLEQLPQVIELLAAADEKFVDGEFAAARDAYQQAAKLDPQHQRAMAGLEQSNTKIRDSKLQNALNQGFAYLSQSNYAGASQAFRRALAADPNSDVAAQSLLQAQTELKQIQINRLLTAASNHEQQEQWPLAVEAYEQALNIDSSVVSATIGKLRSQTRATLDADLKRTIEAPLRLASSQVYKQAQQLLTDAKGIQPGGTRLARQVGQLEAALRLATTPQNIMLASDNATRVTILRVARLGQFSEKTIQLKPGKYVAEGIRKGYRDIRVDFIVDGKNAASPIQIACKEVI